MENVQEARGAPIVSGKQRLAHPVRPEESPMLLRRQHPWLYLAPALVVLAAVYFYPIGKLAVLSLSAPGGGIGFDNFRLLFQDPTFISALEHNAFLLLGVPISLVLALGLALLLFDGPKGSSIYRLAVFIPFVLPVPVIGIAMGLFLQRNGVLNQLLRALHLHFLALDWLGSPSLALPTVLGVIVWRNLGFGVLVFYARLMTLDRELLEAARVDGARGWRLRRFVIIPQLGSVISFYAMITTINMLSWVFNFIYVMTGGGPGGATTVSEYYTYQMAFPNQLQNLAAAAAIVVLIITVVGVAIRIGTSRNFVSLQ
jgi:ABC-type sugar transport system permease subunit